MPILAWDEREYPKLGSVAQAKARARRLLEVRHPSKWAHTQTVAERAERFSVAAGLSAHQQALLVAGAWCHDLGYAFNGPTGWHVTDGARMLAGWEMDDAAALSAWCGARPEEAQLAGMSGQLNIYHEPDKMVLDLLTYLDMTTSPRGEILTFEQRLVDLRARRGQGSRVVTAFELAWPRLTETRTRVEGTLTSQVLVTREGVND